MKKTLRIAALTLTVCVLCGSLCACGALDDLRAAHAVTVSEDTIRLGGNDYRLLPACDDLSPVANQNRSAQLTAPDVPVLLSEFVGQELLQSDDGVFLIDGEAEATVYCRLDRYDEIVRRINSQETMDSYCYYYTRFDEDFFDFQTLSYQLNAAEVQAVERVLSETEPISIDAALLDSYYLTELYACSSDGIFSRQIGGIYRARQTYYLSVDSGYDTRVYQVPAEDDAVFDGICKALDDAEASDALPPDDEDVDIDIDLDIGRLL